MKKAMFILNPSAGKERAIEYKDQVEETLKSMGYSVTTKETQKKHDATEFAKEACM
jgi:diacylglycerol kinase (ATP)